jgi:hypothetical protein
MSTPKRCLRTSVAPSVATLCVPLRGMKYVSQKYMFDAFGICTLGQRSRVFGTRDAFRRWGFPYLLRTYFDNHL